MNMKYLILITRKSVAAVEENFIHPENMAIILISGTETGQEFRDSLESRPLMNECTAPISMPSSWPLWWTIVTHTATEFLINAIFRIFKILMTYVCSCLQRTRAVHAPQNNRREPTVPAEDEIVLTDTFVLVGRDNKLQKRQNSCWRVSTFSLVFYLYIFLYHSIVLSIYRAEYFIFIIFKSEAVNLTYIWLPRYDTLTFNNTKLCWPKKGPLYYTVTQTRIWVQLMFANF